MFFIYRLTDGEQDYYGQTENPDKRLITHKVPSNTCRSRLLDSSKMKLHIIHRLYTQEEADEIEEFYQLNFDCLNKKITGRTEKQRYQTNRDNYLIKNRKYYNENKEKENMRNKIYYNENKEKFNRRIVCECGSTYTCTNKSNHFKTKKHQDYISQK